MSLIAAVYNSVLGLRKRTWASGMTVKKNEVVKSPADNEDYERIAATGAGTTDPADDVTNYVARSYVRTTSLPKGVSSTVGSYSGASINGATAATAGAIAVGVRTLALNITGRGAIHYLLTGKAESGGMRTEIFIDGRALLDESNTTSVGVSHLYIGGVVVSTGETTAYRAVPVFNAVQFRRSVQVYLTATSSPAYSTCGVAYIVGGIA